MKIETSNGFITAQMTVREAIILANCMNEALHGISVPDFEVRVSPRKEANALHTALLRAIRRSPGGD